MEFLYYLSVNFKKACHISSKSFLSSLQAFAIWLFSKRIRAIRRNILLGKDEDYSDHPSLRWKKTCFCWAFGQKENVYKKTLL